jgi:hypothetical protein
MKRLIQLAGLVLLLAALPAARAADVSGNWKGAFDFQGTSVPLTFHLAADGNALTGSVEGLPTTPAEIHEGKIDGNKITFWLTTDYQGTEYKLVYNGTLSADGESIAFDFGTDTDDWSAEVKAERVPVAAPPQQVNTTLVNFE